jgi:hypothetical protein
MELHRKSQNAGNIRVYQRRSCAKLFLRGCQIGREGGCGDRLQAVHCMRFGPNFTASGGKPASY